MKTLLFVLVMIPLLTIPKTSFCQVTATYDEVVSKKKKGQLTSYTTQKGETFSVGDTITLGEALSNEAFDNVMQDAGLSYEALTNTAAHAHVIIKKIKGTGKLVQVKTTKPQGYVYGLIIINFEAAVITGEVQSRLMSSDQALEELGKWKKKLDFGLITEEEYEAKKKELAKLIN